MIMSARFRILLQLVTLTSNSLMHKMSLEIYASACPCNKTTFQKQSEYETLAAQQSFICFVQKVVAKLQEAGFLRESLKS
jgi:hypothetical protein